MQRHTATFLASAIALVLSAAAHAADAPDGPTIAKHMRAALEPGRASVRQLVIEVSAEHGENARWTAGQARKRVKGRHQMLTVMLAPKDVEGIAFLVQEGGNGAPGGHTVNIYLPSLRRTRTLTGVSAYEAFLGSDFTYADLGFESTRATYSLLKSGERDGAAGYEIQAIPANPWYYKRIVTWVNAKTFLPAIRTYYGPDGEPWKVERIEGVTTIDGVPTPLRFVMKDEEAGGQTTITVSGVRYDAEIPDTIFDPAKLRDAVSSPLWRGLGE